jgi:hypothetical protein
MRAKREQWFRSVLTGLLQRHREMVSTLEAIIGDLPPSEDKLKCSPAVGKHRWASSRAPQCACGFVLRSDR